jgi:hypothetical protein
MLYVTGAHDYIRPGKTVRKNFPSAIRLPVLKGNKNDVVTLLLKRGSIPGSMEGNEGSILIAFRKLVPRIKDKIIGRHMTRESHDWFFLIAAATYGFTITAVFGAHYFFTAKMIKVTIGPSKIISVGDLKKFLRWQFRVLFIVVHFRPKRAELIAAMLQRKQSLR